MNRKFAWGYATLSVLISLGTGILTNLITDEFHWGLAGFLAMLAVAGIALLAWSLRQPNTGDAHEQQVPGGVFTATVIGSPHSVTGTGNVVGRSVKVANRGPSGWVLALLVAVLLFASVIILYVASTR